MYVFAVTVSCKEFESEDTVDAMKTILRIITLSLMILLLQVPAGTSGGPQISFPEHDIAIGAYGAWVASEEKGIAAAVIPIPSSSIPGESRGRLLRQ